MHITDMILKIKEYDELKKQINFLKPFTSGGIREIKVSPAFREEIKIPDDMVKSFLGKGIIKNIKDEINKLELEVEKVLEELGAKE